MGQQRFWGFLAHACIIIGMMFVIFFVIDRFNSAMEFLTSSISKWLILILAVCSILNGLFSAVFLFQKQKRHEERMHVPHAGHAEEPRRALPQGNAHPYDPRGPAAPQTHYAANRQNADRPMQRPQGTAGYQTGGFQRR